MDKKNIAFIVAALVIVGGGAFYGGFRTGAASRFARFSGGVPQFRGSAEAFTRGALAGKNGTGVRGEIVAKGGESITVKLRDGGSQIVFYSSSTPVSVSASGSADDLRVGATVAVTGTANSDGSIAADSIQLTPDAPLR